MDGNDDTTNLGLAIVAVVVFIVLLTSYAFGCEIKPKEADPAPSEIQQALDLIGSDAKPRGAITVAYECMPGARLGYYAANGYIVLADGWRQAGGLTRLVHELWHVQQRAEHRPESECEASKLAADYADLNGFTNEARRERSYGSAYCH